MYGTFMKSIREAEDHFSEQMYDFTFPVYVSKMDKDLYRDQPFVTVVAAPRVVLLVYDGLAQVQSVLKGLNSSLYRAIIGDIP